LSMRLSLPEPKLESKLTPRLKLDLGLHICTCANRHHNIRCSAVGSRVSIRRILPHI
jgi:hypothetical protein